MILSGGVECRRDSPADATPNAGSFATVIATLPARLVGRADAAIDQLARRSRQPRSGDFSARIAGCRVTALGRANGRPATAPSVAKPAATAKAARPIAPNRESTFHN